MTNGRSVSPRSMDAAGDLGSWPGTLLMAPPADSIPLENLPAISYTASLDLSQTQLDFSPGLSDLLGFSQAEWLHNPGLWRQQIHPDDRLRLEAEIERVGQDGAVFVAEYRMLGRGDQVAWFHDRAVLVRGPANRPQFLQGVKLDITERKQVEAALRESQQRYQALVNSIDGIVWELDPKTFHFTLVSQQAERILGYPLRTWLEDPDFWASHIHPDDREWAVNFCLNATAEKRSHEFEYRMLAADGHIVWLHDFVTVIVDADQPVRLCGVMIDVTHHKQREREMEVIALLSAALRTAPTRAEMLPVILDQLLELLKGSGAAVLLRQGQADFHVELGRGAGESLTGQRAFEDGGMTAEVMETATPFLTNTAQADPRLPRPHLMGDLPTMTCVPLVAQGEPIGGLWLGRQTPMVPEDHRLLMAVANIAANAIHRATLHEETQRRLHYLAALRKIDIAITNSLDVNVVLSILLDQATSQLGVDAADVLLLRPGTQRLEFAAGRGFHSRTVDALSVRLGEGLAGRACLERRLVHIPDLSLLREPSRSMTLLQDEGFVAYFAMPLMAKGQVQGVLEILSRSPVYPDSEWHDFLEALARQAAIAIDNAALFNDLQTSNAELTIAYDATIEGWSRALDLRDQETEGHTQRVTELTLQMARMLGMNHAELVHVRWGSLLHDIGKMGIPDSILHKPGPLTEEEWVVMRQHPVYAYEMIAPIAYLHPAIDIPYCHHEKWDGTGYPRGLSGEQIPLAARIFAVADVWDALCSDRPYRQGWPRDKALAWIRSLSGTHFDPRAVDVFLRLMDENR